MGVANNPGAPLKALLRQAEVPRRRSAQQPSPFHRPGFRLYWLMAKPSEGGSYRLGCDPQAPEEPPWGLGPGESPPEPPAPQEAWPGGAQSQGWEREKTQEGPGGRKRIPGAHTPDHCLRVCVCAGGHRFCHQPPTILLYAPKAPQIQISKSILIMIILSFASNSILVLII